MLFYTENISEAVQWRSTNINNSSEMPFFQCVCNSLKKENRSVAVVEVLRALSNRTASSCVQIFGTSMVIKP